MDAFNESMVPLIAGLSEVRIEGSKTCVSPGNHLIHLPQEIIFNIFSRLPVDSVLQCRRVCKTWRNLPILNNAYFADMHLRHQLFHSETKKSFLFFDRNGSYYLFEYDENKECSYKTHKRMNLPTLPATIGRMVGSCNGLICLCEHFETLNNDPAYICSPVCICNPITREFVLLPRFIYNAKHVRSHIKYGFGYHASTNVYKVVRIYYCLDQRPPYIGQVEVYTLGSGTGWRSKGEFTHGFHDVQPGVLCNGALHWVSDQGNILAFDLADEEFRCLPNPPCHVLSPVWVFGGCLCVVDISIYVKADIWLFKKKEKQSTSSSGDDTKEHAYQSWSWSREFTIPIHCQRPTLQPFAVTKAIVCFDPKTTAEPITVGDHVENTRDYRGTPHFNSFVSLKAIGENAEKYDQLTDFKSKSD